MAREEKRRYYEYDDDYDLPIKKKPIVKKSNTLLYALLGGGIALLLVCCVAGMVIVGIMSSDDGPTAAKLVGSWKGRFVLAGQPLDSTYTFKNDGTFREETFDVQGGVLNISDGHWRVRRGQIEIDWIGGTFERAVATWVDDNTMDYQIVDHTQFIQIGTITNFRRK